MNRSVYEGKFLLNLLGSTLRQDDSFPVVRRMNWGRLYRIADYHELSSAIYLGMLSAGARVPALFGERFFRRYQEAVRYGEVYESSELEILDAFQALKVPAVILESAAVRRLYRIPETAANSPLRLYISEEKYYLAKGYLIDLGYETDIFYKGFGEHMKRPGGFQIEIYHTMPYITKTYKRCMKGLLDRAYQDKNRPSLKVLSLESSYMLRLAEGAYHFCTDSLKIRELLDLYLFYKLFYKDMNHRFLEARIKELGIPVLAQSLLQIADMWFSSRKDSLFPYPKDSISLYDDMEARILSNGTVGVDSIPEAARLRKAILDAENKEERAEKWRKWREKWKNRVQALHRKIRWAFPDRKYMASLYPELENRAFLLPFYWIKRGVHLLHILSLSDKVEEKTGETDGKTAQSEVEKRTGAAAPTTIREMTYQDDPFRTNGRKKVFYKKRSAVEGTEAAAVQDGVAAEEEIPELPLNEDRAFLSEEIDESGELPKEERIEEDPEKESEWNLWDFSAPAPRVEAVAAQSKQTTESKESHHLSEEEEEKALALLSALLTEDGAPTLSEAEMERNEKEVEERYRKSLEGDRISGTDTVQNEAAGTPEEKAVIGTTEGSAAVGAPKEKTEKKEEYATLDGKAVKVQSWTFPKEKKEE